MEQFVGYSDCLLIRNGTMPSTSSVTLTSLIRLVKETIDTVLVNKRHSGIIFPELITGIAKLGYDTVNTLFFAKEGISLEHYIINRKIALIKENLNRSDG